MSSFRSPRLEIPSYLVNKCSCTCLWFKGCKHAAILKSNACRLLIHDPRSANLMTWEKETCADAPRVAAFMPSICRALFDPTWADKIQFGKVKVNGKVIDIVVAELELADKPPGLVKRDRSSMVRFVLPYSSNSTWETREAHSDQGGADQDRYEEVTRQLNKKHRELADMRLWYRHKILSIELDITTFLRSYGPCLEACSWSDPCECLLDRRRTEMLEKKYELEKQMFADIKVLRIHRELAAYGVTAASTAKSLRRMTITGRQDR